jgi:LPXTG-motif cell wall-anchored protein
VLECRAGYPRVPGPEWPATYSSPVNRRRAAWSVASPGRTVTLSGNHTNNSPGAATFPIQLSVAGATAEVITSFIASAYLAGCAQSAGNIITCSFAAGASGELATITATVVVPAGAVGQAWQGDASSGNMGLGTDILPIVEPPPTTSTTTTTAAAAQTATTRPASALPATGSSSPELSVAAALLVLAGGGIVFGVRRRRVD